MVDVSCSTLSHYLALLTFCARQHYAIARICYRPSVRLSVCLSVTRVDQSKTVEVRIMQLSPQSSPIITLSFLMVNFAAKFQRENREGAEALNTRGIGKIGNF